MDLNNAFCVPFIVVLLLLGLRLIDAEAEWSVQLRFKQ